MNRLLENRMKKLEARDGKLAPAIIVYAKWDELNEDAIRNAFAGPPPTHIRIYVFTDRMTGEEWSESCRRTMADPAWAEGRGGSGFIAFAGMASAKRIHIVDRPVKC